jgi:CMP-N-acetylneuraminic acid synthetase/quercetin dioxygenase-like cupin family protein|tara:strand:+ start:33519 stop:34655 length:1137 start_codon:yes stop_codon:yes gene_type:complete
MKIAMIPARMGSKRVEKKNIRLINGKPMISYVIESVKKADCFDAIWVNSESDLIGEIATGMGVNFYKRPEHLSSDTATNDEFVNDFLENVKCDHIIQVLPTSPFITPDEIIKFTKKLTEGVFETLISVKEEQISCVYNYEAINFNPTKTLPPSQDVNPVKVYATSLMGWEVNSFKNRWVSFGAAYHGGIGAWQTNYFTLKGYSTIDIDNEEDFVLAEVVAKVLELKPEAPKYYNPNERYEADVPSVLLKDGVELNDLFDCNNERVSIPEILKNKPSDKSWSKRLVDSENNSATLIHQLPSEGNRRHYHDNWNEWWYIVQGQWKWEIEGKEVIVREGDFVYIEKGKWHQITAVGNSPAIRLAVSRADVNHIYDENIEKK